AIRRPCRGCVRTSRARNAARAARRGPARRPPTPPRPAPKTDRTTSPVPWRGHRLRAEPCAPPAVAARRSLHPRRPTVSRPCSPSSIGSRMSDLPELKTVPAVDLARYMGTWYEIARLPTRHEPREATDISATYALQEDGSVEVRNRMRLDGEVDEAVGRATANDARGSGLEVTILPEGRRWIALSVGDYWLTALGPGYPVALVGSPGRKSLWLLARGPARDELVREHYPGIARPQGFDLAPLIL